MNEAWRPDGWQARAVIGSAVVGAVGYLGFALWGGWREVLAALHDVGTVGLAITLSMSLVNYGLRFCRWQIYLDRLGYKVPWRPSLRIYLAGFALTTTPGKLGEGLRSILLRAWEVPYRHSFAAFFSERISDLFAIVVLALIGFSIYPALQPVVVTGLLIALGGLAVLGNDRATRYAYNALERSRGRIIALLRHLIGVFIEARRCHSPGALAIAMVLSLVAWGAEAWAFHYLLDRMGMETSMTFAVFVYAVAMLAGALSFLPGGLGGAEAVMVALLIWKGMDPARAVAATLVIRLATLWFAVGLGALALALGPTRFSPPLATKPCAGEGSNRRP